MAKLASGRVQTKSAELLDLFNASLPFDRKLYEEDVEGSIAHATMLAKQGILSEKELEMIKKGLAQIKEEIAQGKFRFDISDEDIHMAIEKRLTELIGDAGKRLHTARSRNDQVALDFRLYVQKKTKALYRLLVDLEKSLLKQASRHTETMLPGMTHLQHAQPTNLGYHLMAYASMFRRDVERFESSRERNNLSPLGCAALAGTPHPVDRRRTAEELGFREPTLNCLDTVSDRDFALEILFNIATLMMHISRLSEELILWSTSEFGFVRLSDKHATGSSIMPQKKNPDAAEMVRGKTGAVYGALMQSLSILKGLPSGYNRDLQEDRLLLWDTLDTARMSLKVLCGMLGGAQFNKKRMKEMVDSSFAAATELANHLVKKNNISFRESHEIIGFVVRKLDEKGKTLADIDEAFEILNKKINGNITANTFKKVVDSENIIKANKSLGGTAPREVERMICSLRADMKAHQKSVRKKRNKIIKAREKTEAEVMNILINRD